MDVLEKIDVLRKEIHDLRHEAYKKTDELVEWARNNKTEIKKHFPKKGKIYEIIDPGSTFGWEKYENSFWYNNMYFSNDEKFYFKVTNASFIPARDFDKSGGYVKMPCVKGIILDCELNNIFGVSEDFADEIEIIYLKNVDDEILSDKPTNVYVMIDKNTGYYKIGKSKKPQFREKTLQSEKPTIEMLFTHEGRCSDEKALHEMFKEKRIRGEWFDLSGSDLKIINSYFKDKKHVSSAPPFNFEPKETRRKFRRLSSYT